MKCFALSALVGSAFAASATLSFQHSNLKTLALNYDGSCEGTLSVCGLAMKSDVTQEIDNAVQTAITQHSHRSSLSRLDAIEGNHTALKSTAD